ncbi:MAG TPA: MBL fold metallo-hydrolase [Vicinamibacterales bacterium]|nr:MBL fold metallo-hydrolase [Vicinamibacterales bacterium]
MRRALVLGALVVVGALSAAVAASQQPGEKPKLLEVEKLRDNLFVLRGGGGNTGVFITSAGVVVVDSKNPGWGQPLLDKIKELTPKPVTHLINTHTHFDHVSGNVEFPTTVEVVAHENTAALMKEMRTVTGFKPQPGNIFTEHKGRGLPKRTFNDTLVIGTGADRVDLHYFGRGHTSGDAWVVFPSLRVVHAGDIFPGKNVPILDANNGGSGAELGDTLDKAAAGLKNVDTIITGHSTQMTMADLRQYAEFNRDFANAVREGKKAGRSIDEIAKNWTIPATYTGYSEPQAARLRANVEVVYNEIK